MLTFSTPVGDRLPSALYLPRAAGDLDVRFANIWKSAGRNIERVTKHSAERHSDIAKLICYGPSLADNWQSIPEGEGDVWTVSGANTYLTKRGITPMCHMECDTRPHKAELLKGCNEQTLYLIASRCPDELFDALEGKRRLMYHVYAKEESAILDMAFPGEFCVPPAWTMGVTAWNILLLLGYRKIITWAMDGSYTEDGRQHPEDHPNEDPTYQSFTVDGDRTFLSSPNHMVAAECVIRMIEALPYGTLEFVGDGMIPHMVRQHQTPCEA
jgi:hypothetical protein